MPCVTFGHRKFAVVAESANSPAYSNRLAVSKTLPLALGRLDARDRPDRDHIHRQFLLHLHGNQPLNKMLPHLSPLGLEHINLTADYLWRQSKQVDRGRFRSLRPFAVP